MILETVKSWVGDDGGNKGTETVLIAVAGAFFDLNNRRCILRKGWFLVVMMFLLVPCILVGCGVAQEEHDAVVAQLGTAQQEVHSIKAEMDASQAKVSELTLSLGEAETELEAKRAQISELNSSLERSEAELEATQGELETIKAQNSELNSSLEATRSEISAIKSENEDLKQANDKLKRLEITQLVLCSKQPTGPDSYVPQPENAYKAGSTVYINCTFFGYKLLFSKDEGFNRDYNVSLVIKDAEGKIAASREEGFTKPIPTPMGGHWQWFSFTRLEPNSYTVELEVTDFYSGETVTKKEEFRVGSSEEGSTT